MLFWTRRCLSSFSAVVKTHREAVLRQPEVLSVGVGFLCLSPAPESHADGPDMQGTANSDTVCHLPCEETGRFPVICSGSMMGFRR